jgi:hypothetical protein
VPNHGVTESCVDTPMAPAPFVVGVPRSGTTALRLMLDAHSRLAIPPETGFVARFARRPWWWPSSLGRRRFVYLLTSAPQWRDFHLDAGALASAVESIQPFTPADGLRAFYRLYAARFGKTRWGDKTPLYGPAADAIARLLPEARFIHIIRDGRDVALSLRPLWFAPTRDLCALGRYWAQLIEDTRRAGARTPHFLELRYEDLMADPEPELRRVCAFIDLDFDPAMLDFHRRAPARLDEHETHVASDGRVVATKAARLEQQWRTTRPPDPSRIARWRDEMTSDERRAFEQEAGAMLASLGYPVER